MQSTQEKLVTVDFDAGGDRFLIRCPIWANDVIKELPNRRWLKRARAWGAPAIRRNVEFIASKLRDTGMADFSDAASDALDTAIVKLSEMLVKTGFPSWYEFKTKPRDHQRKALDKWYGNSAFALLMDRGTGKTKTVIDMVCALRMEGKIDAVIIVCKFSGRRNWPEEWEMHAPLPALFHLPHTGKKRAYEKFLAEKHDLPILVIGHESLSAGGMADIMKKFALAYKNVFMAVDEAHYILNIKSKRTQNCIAMFSRTSHRVILTGTPISTGPMNLYSQFEFLDPDVIGIGDFYAFRNRYAVMGGFRNELGRPMQIVAYQNLDELTTTLAPYVYECRKSDVLDLPPKIFERVYVELTKEQRVLYDEVKKKGTYSIKGGERQSTQNVLEVALRLHQICGGYITSTHEEERLDGRIKKIPTINEIVPWQKNPKIKEILELAEDGKPMIVWCAYMPEIKAVARALRATFPNESVREIHGGIDDEVRNDYKLEFQSGKTRLLVGNTTTGGTSLTLTACEIMVYYNNTEKMIDREQSEDRAHRDGLKHSVLYVDLMAEKTVDITIHKSIQQKINLSDYIRNNIADAARLLEGD